ncbi:MAG: CHAT domain-containing protein [Hyphomonadaceae bacterium]|nr:CHAT domain-containing protein [Hyphomonadaceae bacterium]
MAKALAGAGALGNAIVHANEAVALIRGAPNAQPIERAVLEGNQGAALMRAGRFAEADTALHAAEITARAQGQPDRLIAIHLLQIELDRHRNNLAPALALSSEALRAARDLDPRYQGLALDALIQRAETLRASGDALGSIESLVSLPAPVRTRPEVLTVLAASHADRLDLANAARLLREAEAQSVASGDCQPLLGASIAVAAGNIHLMRREADLARQAFLRALDAYDSREWATPHRRAAVLHGLATAARFDGDYDASERYFAEARALFSQSYGPNAVQTARATSEHALMRVDRGDGAGAALLARESLGVLTAQNIGTDRDRANAYAALGLALSAQGAAADALAAFQNSNALFSRSTGAASVDLAPGLIEIGHSRLNMGDFDGARSPLAEALRAYRSAGALTTIAAARAHALLARAEWGAGAHEAALVNSAEAVAIVNSRLAVRAHALSSDEQRELRQARTILESELQMSIGRLTAATPERAFLAAQLALTSRTGVALVRAADRMGGDASLAQLLAQRDELLAQWSAADVRLGGSLTDGDASPVRRALFLDLAQVEADLRALDARIAAEHRDFARLSSMRPLSLREAQALLRPSEAMIVFILGQHQSWAIVVRHAGASAHELQISNDEASRLISDMRTGLEIDTWRSSSRPTPFRTQSAFALYEKLFRIIEPELAGKTRLLIVVDRAVSALPFGALLRSAPAAAPRTPDAYRALDWLGGGERALIVLPSVSALPALRAVAGRSRGDRAFLGVGAAQFGPQRMGGSRGISVRPLPSGVRREDNPIAAVSSLPETRTELRTIADAFGAPESDLLLGAEASETRLGALALSRYRVIGFATHAVLSGEWQARAEPGLLLTPPASTTSADDGYLGASEIARWRLDADVALLSACNTAGPDGAPDGEGFSGLARAFLLAGARGVVGTHWRLDSEAALLFSTTAMDAYARGVEMPEAQAQAIARLRDHRGYVWSAHPAFWAPFVYVGL